MAAEKREVYADTVLHVGADPPFRIDLRREPGTREHADLDRVGLSVPFAVLTAFNPRGSAPSARDEDRSNRAAQTELERRLRTEGHPFVRIEGCSPDGHHCEPSVAAPIPEILARELAVRFEQDAYFWYDGARFWLVGVLEDIGRVRLPLDGAVD